MARHAAFIVGSGWENEGEREWSGWKERWAGCVAWIYSDACSDATVCCVNARLPPVQRHYSSWETRWRRQYVGALTDRLARGAMWSGFGLGTPDESLCHTRWKFNLEGMSGWDFLRWRHQTAFGAFRGASGDSLRPSSDVQRASCLPRNLMPNAIWTLILGTIFYSQPERNLLKKADLLKSLKTHSMCDNCRVVVTGSGLSARHVS
jgi:hypothetical protein